MRQPVVSISDQKSAWLLSESNPHADQGKKSEVSGVRLPAMGLSAKLGLAMVVALLAIGWHRTFLEMWWRWFPAWSVSRLSWAERFTQGDSYYSHGPLVGLVSVVFAILVYRRVGFPNQRDRTATWFGSLLLTASLTLHLLSVSPGGGVMFVSGFALIGVLAGLVLLWGGWPATRAYGLPILLLCFMVPLPEVAIVDINFQLKMMAGRWAIWMTNHVLGLPALLDGSYIYLAPDAVGNPKILVIESVCGGLRSLIALIWFASLFAIVCRLRGVWRGSIVLLAIPMAMFCNVVRIASLNWAADRLGIEVATPGGWFHDLSGLLVFVMALVLLLGFEQFVVFLNRWLRRDWVDEHLLKFLYPLSEGRALGFGAPRWGTLGLLVLTASLSAYWSVRTIHGPTSYFNANTIPNAITVDGVRFIGQDHDLDARTVIILEHPEYLRRTYTDARTGRSIDLLVVYSNNNRKGTHPPEVCLEGSGQVVVEKGRKPVAIPGTAELSMRELLTQQSRAMTCFLYTYKCGRQFTSSFFAQQFRIFLNGLMARDTTGAMIRLSVTDQTQAIQQSRDLTLAAAELLLPHINAALVQGGRR